MLFVSHASQDQPALGELMSALRDARQQVWLDEELSGGEAWWRTILEAIRGCEVFVVALSNNWLASKPCRAELQYAEALQRPVLPVQIGPVDSLRVTPLAATQIIDYRQPTLDKGIQLVEALHERRAQLRPLPSPLPDEPPVPFAYLMRLARTLAGPELSPHQQVGLLSELKAGLQEDRNDPTARRDLVRLLRMLRDRPDVTWHTRTEIDTLLASIDEEPSATRAEPAIPTATGPEPVEIPPARPALTPVPKAGPRSARRVRAKWLIAGVTAVAATAGVVVAVVLVRQGPGPVLPLRERLDSLLPSDQDINRIMGAADMKTVEQGKESFKQSDVVKVSPTACMGPLYPGADGAYTGSGEEHLYWKVLTNPGAPKATYRAGDDNFVDQAVAAFAGSDQASAFVASSATKWNDCAGKQATAAYADGHKYTWTIGNRTMDDNGGLTQQYTQEGGGYTCQRVLRPVADIVIDVKACGHHITNEASRIADTAAAKVMASIKAK